MIAAFLLLAAAAPPGEDVTLPLRLGLEEPEARIQIVEGGPERWLGLLEELRADLELDTTRVMLATWHDLPTFRSIVVARSVSAPVDDAELARPIGRLAFAGEHTAGPEWHGSMEGAVRSGHRAARDLLAFGARAGASG